MKRILLALVAVTVIAGTTNLPGQGRPQTKRNPNVPLPHRVGLIDMAFVFQEYDKFEALRGDLKEEIERTDAHGRKYLEEIQRLQEQLKALKADSNQYAQLEKQALEIKSKYDGFVASSRRDLMRKESQIYKTVYLETSDAVREFARIYNYTLIMRFSRKSVDDSASPPEIVKNMNRQVVFFRDDDDITDKILNYLNSTYKKTSSGGTRTSRRPAGTQPSQTR